MRVSVTISGLVYNQCGSRPLMHSLHSTVQSYHPAGCARAPRPAPPWLASPYSKVATGQPPHGTGETAKIQGGTLCFARCALVQKRTASDWWIRALPHVLVLFGLAEPCEALELEPGGEHLVFSALAPRVRCCCSS